MPAAVLSDADFERLFTEIGATGLARQIGQAEAIVYKRRKRLEQRLGRQITGPDHRNRTRHNVSNAQRVQVDITNGIALVGSDLHVWPGERSTAFRGLKKFISDMKPKVIVMNGDVIDGASISRHPPIGWEKQPTLIEEIEAAQEALQELLLGAPKSARLIWPLGNHDARFSTRIATVAPEFAKIHGVRLQDHFGERWEPCWSAWLNDDVVVKHRHKNGIHAVHNSTMWAGKTMVTGHLHSLKVTPFTDYNQTRFGVDTGTLADPDGAQFNYLEDNPRNWRSGFVVLTFREGRLLWPEVVHVVAPDTIEFRGQWITV